MKEVRKKSNKEEQTVTKSVKSSSDRTKQETPKINQTEGNVIIKKREEPVIAKNNEQLQPSKIMRTRRASMMIEMEERSRTDRERRSRRRASVTPHLEVVNSTGSSTTTEKKESIKREEGKDVVKKEHKSITEKSTEAKGKVSEQRASSAAKREGAKSPTEGVKQTKESGDGKSNKATSKINQEAEKNEQKTSVKIEQEKQRRNKKRSINKEVKAPKQSPVGEVQKPRKVGSRRASMLERQEKELQANERESRRERRLSMLANREEEEEKQVRNKEKEHGNKKSARDKQRTRRESRSKMEMEKEESDKESTEASDTASSKEDEEVESSEKEDKSEEDVTIKKEVKDTSSDEEESETTDKDSVSEEERDDEENDSEETGTDAEKSLKSRSMKERTEEDKTEGDVGEKEMEGSKDKDDDDDGGKEDSVADEDGDIEDKDDESAKNEEENDAMTIRKESEIQDETDKQDSHSENKEGTEKSKDVLNESSESADFSMLKRNKVIKKDKRISRWQNRMMSKKEEVEAERKEEESSRAEPEEMSFHEESDSESDGALVIDEGGDSVGSDHAEGDTGMQNDPACSPRKSEQSEQSVLDSEGSEGRSKRKRRPTKEETPTKDTMASPERPSKRHKENNDTSSKDVTASPTRQSKRLMKDSEDTPAEDTQASPERHSKRLKKDSEEAPAKDTLASPERYSKRLKKESEDTSNEEAIRHSPRKRDEEEENKDPKNKESPQLISPTMAETSLRPQGAESSYDGTLGVSKSGRLRKASAKGIQSIEIKCLFMQRNSDGQRPPPPLPVLKNEEKDKDEDWVQEKRSPVKSERRDSIQEKPSPKKVKKPAKESPPLKKQTLKTPVMQSKETTPVKKQPGKTPVLQGKETTLVKKQTLKTPVLQGKETTAVKKSPAKKYTLQDYYGRGVDNEYSSYSRDGGHWVPKFRETDHNLGYYCSQAGLTVNDLNSDKKMNIKMTFGMIKELHDFYTTRKATKTSLAVRLFKMAGKEFIDNTHLLSTVIRIKNIGKMKLKDEPERLGREFKLPNRVTYRAPEKDNLEVETSREMKEGVLAKSAISPVEMLQGTVRGHGHRRCVKPEDSGDEELYENGDLDEQGKDEGEEEDEELDDDLREVYVTRGEKGSITRGDIVYLYTKWLKNKMSGGSNAFVTDLLHSVEELMTSRGVEPLRIPAGTLMSSSVRLHDEYKQILKISKEDAIMYLQEDWLEDIKYLLSIAVPSRRNTTEMETIPAAPLTPPDEENLNNQKGKVSIRSSGSKEGESSKSIPAPINVPAKNPSKIEPPVKSKPKSPKSEAPVKSKPKTLPKVEVSRSHQMESVGKRQVKRRNLTKSLEDYDRDILMGLERAGVLEDEDEEDFLSQEDDEDDSDFVEDIEYLVKEERRMYPKPEKKEIKDSTPKGYHQWGYNVSCMRDTTKPPGPKDVLEKIMDHQEVRYINETRYRYLTRWVGADSDVWMEERHIPKSDLNAYWDQKRGKKPGKPKLLEKPTKTKGNSQNETERPKPKFPLPDLKENESIIQVMVKHGSSQHTEGKEESPVVTKRELLTLYDSWRKLNQEEQMSGGSNMVDLCVFVDAVRDLMKSRGVKFYPESILNACFMMTLMKTRLQSKMAINRFLDTSCLEVLESSHKQYMKRYARQVIEEEVRSKKPSPPPEAQDNQAERKETILKLKSELNNLKLDLMTAQKWRSVKHSQLRAVEEEVTYLEDVVDIPDSKRSKKITYFEDELQKLRDDVRMLERCKDPGTKDSQSMEVPLFAELDGNSEKCRTRFKNIRNQLSDMKLSKPTVSTIMEVVLRRTSTKLMQE